MTTLRSSVDSAERVLVGLIGRDILASRSPTLHEAEADAQGLRLVYTLFDFAQLGLEVQDLPRMLSAAELVGFAGVNVTHPFKQAVIEHLDTLSQTAAGVGAVNTVEFRGGRRIGHNTDVTGFANAFSAELRDVARDRVALIGAGGGGCAVAHALLSLGVAHLVIHDTDSDRAAALPENLAGRFDAARVSIAANPAEAAHGVDGVVNATPVGMAAHPGMAIPAESLRADMWVADIVYFPLETALLAAARAKGCRVMNGSAMAVYQAAHAFEIFTGRRADAARMQSAFRALGF